MAKLDDGEISAGDGDPKRKVEALEKKVDELSAKLTKYEALGEGSKSELEKKAVALEKAARNPDIEGVSDAMLNDVREEIRTLHAKIDELGGKLNSPVRKSWF